MKNTVLLLIILFLGCAGKEEVSKATYSGTASVTQGRATTTSEDIYTCGRKTDLGEITSSDGKKWIVPAKTNYMNENFPFAADLFNSCEGKDYATAQEALSHSSNIVEVDKDGELFSAYIFADNYFEMYVNGVAVGKDRVPFTEFNSSIVQFKTQRPFTIAMKLVDWEETLGLGSEANRGDSFHTGDGGMVAVIKDAQDNIVAITSEHWKAQTFYTAPITDLACPSEDGTYRDSSNCEGSGPSSYALHWEIPSNWMQADFDDAAWPSATTYSNGTIGVDNKRAYTNFTSIFDDAKNDAEFIWSGNVVLDNEVLVRYTVD